MAFKTRRQGRKNELLRVGFLPFEAHALSAIKRDVEWRSYMIKARRDITRVAKREKWTKTKFADEIRDLYRSNDWRITAKPLTRLKSIGRLDPWAMAQFYRDEWIAKGYPYEFRPRKKKKRKPRKLSDTAVQEGKRKKRESALEKYDRGRGR